MNIYKYLNILDLLFFGFNFIFEVVDCFNIKMIKKKKFLVNIVYYIIK